MSATPERQVLSIAELFGDIDGVFGYKSTLVIYRLGNAFYRGLSHERYRSDAAFKFEDLYESTVIPLDQFSPIFPPHFTRAPDPLPQDCHVKKPRLEWYNPSYPSHISESVLQEATIWETLIHSPHPNISKYYGCQIQDDHITGLCFSRYHETLMTRVNPDHSGKRLFDPTKRPLKDVKSLLADIERGLKHLHSLGLVHNNINPSNIMFATENDETPIIVNFRSCTTIGHSMQNVGRTPEWYDKKVLAAHPSNDTNALYEIGEWLSRKKNKRYMFEMVC